MFGLNRLIGILGAFCAVVCAHGMGSIHLRTTGIFTMGEQAEGQKLPGVQKDIGARDDLRRRAEAAAAEASDLRGKQTEKDLTAAITLLHESARLFKTAQLNHQAGEAKLQAGEIYFTLSRYPEALSAYQEARNLGNKNPELLCRVLSHMARTYAITGQKSDAGQFSNQAINQCGVLPDPRLVAEALEARGVVLLASGKSPESVEWFTRAERIFEEAKDKDGQAQASLMLAIAHFQDNEQPEAFQFAGKALQLWSSKGDLHGVAEARTDLGIFAATRNEFETAECNYGKSLPVFRHMGDKDNEAILLNSIGHTSMERGDLEASLADYRRAKTIFTGIGDQLGAVEAITGIGKALTAMRQYQRLLPLYKEKLRIAHRVGSSGQEASALADMAGVYELQRQYATARAFYQRALDSYSQAKNDYGAGDTLIRLALLHAKQGEDSEAIEALEKARGLKEKTGQIEDIARINYELASIYRRLNRLQDALTAIEKTIEIIESQRLKIAKFDSRAAYFSSVHKYYALYIQILMLLDRQEPERGFKKLAFEASEKSKVRALLDLLNASKEDSACEELLQRQLALVDTTGNHIADVKPAVPAPSLLTLEQIQAEIGDEDALLEYLLGDEKSYVWLVDKTHITAYELPKAAKIEKLVQAFHAALTAREPRLHEKSLEEYKERVRKADAAYPELARQLSQLLLGQLTFSAKRLLIVPDGPLQYIPFSPLRLAQAGKNHTPLTADYETVFLPSASALSTLRKAAEKRTAPTRTAMIIADPVVDDDDPRLPQTHNSGRKKPQEGSGSYAEQSASMRIALRDTESLQHVSRLKGSGVEAQAIRQMLGPQDVLVESGFKASRNLVLQGALQPYRIIHFATHGIIDARRPEMSGLILSLLNQRGQSQDGYLRLGDIYKLKLSADLVVLSACNSALGKGLESEGIIGLPRGFLHAGSRSVIASLWKVDDDAAAAFMKSFYARIRKGEGPSSALRGAQLDMAGGKDWPQPFYWAAFVLQGDYK